MCTTLCHGTVAARQQMPNRQRDPTSTPGKKRDLFTLSPVTKQKQTSQPEFPSLQKRHIQRHNVSNFFEYRFARHNSGVCEISEVPTVKSHPPTGRCLWHSSPVKPMWSMSSVYRCPCLFTFWKYSIYLESFIVLEDSTVHYRPSTRNSLTTSQALVAS